MVSIVYSKHFYHCSPKNREADTMMSLLGRPDVDAGEVFVNFNQNIT